MKKEEIKVGSLMELFQEKLSSYIKARSDAESNLLKLRSGLTACIKEFERKQGELAGLIKESSSAIIEGKPSVSDKILEKTNACKRECDLAGMRIDDLEHRAIPEAEQAVKVANTNLTNAIGGVLKPVKDEQLKLINSKLQEAVNMGINYVDTVGNLLTDLGINLPSYEREGLQKCFVRPGKLVTDARYKELLGTGDLL